MDRVEKGRAGTLQYEDFNNVQGIEVNHNVGICDKNLMDELESIYQSNRELKQIKKNLRKEPKIYMGSAKYYRRICKNQGYIQSSVWDSIALGKR